VGIDDLPALNAALNAASATLLLFGRRHVRRGNVAAHRACMLTAVGLSTIFLASYVTYHSIHGASRFIGPGWAKAIYFTVLLTHTPLAASLVPLVGIALRRAIRGEIEKHKRIVRWTYPIWLYVSVTGVVIYFMLHRTGWKAP
jgi:putative membrane protein